MTASDHPAWSLATRTVHQPPLRAASPPVATPLYQTATFRADRAATVARYAAEVQPQAFYTRWGNPTVEVFEKTVADLEGGEGCLAFASGMAAVSTTLLGLLAPGDHVVSGQSLYTATTKLLAQELEAVGVAADFVDAADAEAFARAARPRTRVFYLETPSNPMLALTDVAAVCAIARQRGITVVVDNTFASPVNQRPIELGADVVLHSATKYLSGHSDVVAGCAVARREVLERLWHKRTVLGGSLDPFAAWLALRGMKTLALRVEAQNRGALALARLLEEHPKVARVYYPGLPSHPQHALARRQMHGFGGMLSFEVRGGREAGARLVESTRLAVLAVSLGGVETLIEHPASMSHAPLSDEQLRRAGIPPGLVRLSVGIEAVEDLAADLADALSRL